MKISFKTMPPSTNRLYGRMAGRIYVRADARSAKDDIGWEARTQFRYKPFSADLIVEMKVFWPDRRRRDIDNGTKAFLDALTGVLWLDDSQIIKLTLYKMLDKQNPRVELEIDLPNEKSTP